MKSETTPIILMLATFILVDLFIIGGIFWKGHANFIELYKHLKS